ncbi:unnamed protein product [Adineta steineri]|uniref:Aquaporin-like protein n=1 Tax=Adineta steineri TaxID=433720 RepID=A0A814ZMR6_9BILA|nr:unnamed protein product [Adineta steineri]CAF1331921.1 unnamed protein product [Adineta steineri]
MNDDYVPSPSVDSYTTPMEVQIPLLEPSSNHDGTINKAVNKSVAVNTNKSGSSPTIAKIAGNSNKLSTLRVSQNPDNEPKNQTVLEKLFPIGQLLKVEFYQALLSEFIGTFLLVLVCTSTGLPITMKQVPDMHGALAAGLIVATIVVGFGHNSGAHINPAVTVSFLVANEIDIYRALLYIFVQLLGATTASNILRLLVPDHAQGTLGMTMITEGISLSQAFIIEFLITFILCYTVHAICDKRRDDIGGSKALAVGLAVTIGCLFGGPYTGASMNPARSFGPASVMHIWKNHWIYWIGPIAGSVVAGLMYTRVLRKPASDSMPNTPQSSIRRVPPNHV